MKTKTIANKLEQAARVLEENTWIKGDWAQDRNGESCSSRSEKACRFCADGALERVFDDDVGYTVSEALRQQLLSEGHNLTVIGFNDTKAKDKRYITRLFRRTARNLLNGKLELSDA